LGFLAVHRRVYLDRELSEDTMAKQPVSTWPTASAVARRLVVLKYVVVYALTAPPRELLRTLWQKWSAADRETFEADSEAEREKFWQPLREANLWQHVTASERDLAAATLVTMTSQQRADASWRLESAQVLMWALGMIPYLPPYDTQASHDLLKEIPSRDIARFVASVCLRDRNEMEQARDDAELWHWRSRTRQLMVDGQEFRADDHARAAGINSFDDIVRFTARALAEEGRISLVDEDFQAKGKAYRKLSADEWTEVRSIAMERHFALNWLCGHAPGNQWDETSTDT
jgi:hypothetical protein